MKIRGEYKTSDFLIIFDYKSLLFDILCTIFAIFEVSMSDIWIKRGQKMVKYRCIRTDT